MDDETNKTFEDHDEMDEQDVKLRGGPDKLHTSRKAVSKYGTIPSCPACREIERRGQKPGRLGYHHSEACRQRIFNKMRDDPQYKSLVGKYGNRRQENEVDVLESAEGDPEIVSEAQVQEAVAHVNKAILVIQGKLKAEKIKMEQAVKMTNLETQLNVTMTKMLRDKMDVAEIYSPPRVAAMARRMGL